MTIGIDENGNILNIVKLLGVSGGGGGTGGSYTDLTNKPKINNVTLSGNKTSSDLSLAGIADDNTFTGMNTFDDSILVDSITDSTGINVIEVATDGTRKVGSVLKGLKLATNGDIEVRNGSESNISYVETVATTTITDSSTITLAKNTIYNGSTLTALTIQYPTGSVDFIAEVDFTSGSTATTLTIPSGTKFKGDDTTSSAFTPVASKRYQCIFSYDGVSFRCVVSGEATA